MRQSDAHRNGAIQWWQRGGPSDHRAAKGEDSTGDGSSAPEDVFHRVTVIEFIVLRGCGPGTELLPDTPVGVNGPAHPTDLMVRRRVTVIADGPRRYFQYHPPGAEGAPVEGAGHRLDDVLTGAISDAVAGRAMDVISQRTDWWWAPADSAFTELADTIEQADESIHDSAYWKPAEKFVSAVQAESPLSDAVPAVAREFPLPFDDAVDHAARGLKVIGVVVFALAGHLTLAAGCAKSLLHSELRREISEAVREELFGPPQRSNALPPRSSTLAECLEELRNETPKPPPRGPTRVMPTASPDGLSDSDAEMLSRIQAGIGNPGRSPQDPDVETGRALPQVPTIGYRGP